MNKFWAKDKTDLLPLSVVCRKREQGRRRQPPVGKKVVEDITDIDRYNIHQNPLSTADSIPCGPGDSKSGPADSKSGKGSIRLLLLIRWSYAELTYHCFATVQGLPK